MVIGGLLQRSVSYSKSIYNVVLICLYTKGLKI